MGAHKPLHLSNTAFFDICLGWKGICVEPSSTFDEFAGIRSCSMAKHCMWSRTEPLRMLFRSEGDASLIIDEKEQQRIHKLQPEVAKRIFECNGISALDLFDRFNARDKHGNEVSLKSDIPEQKIPIDFISLDVEGAEAEVLKCFPFDKYDVKVWTIEVNRNELGIDEIMLAHGYVKDYHLTFFQSRLDAVYVKRPAPMQVPWQTHEEWLQWKKGKENTFKNRKPRIHFTSKVGILTCNISTNSS
ncbi:methyltransferase FkbM family [Reticulomyxa filosa]|uniref:Methyltransferase FkbM family n=1 Tax=Reticulomyxa filosa TaxID=46433 RepID=X6PAT7_RETFI|nr:methyltransferase FkbM family [Reticulomyxa filosa]|eukprot:ETO34757.1 methyltransferase FkbM family [Reticulomyxa filosa]